MKRFFPAFILLFCFLLLTGNVYSQAFSFNCTRDTTIPGCNTACFNLQARIPDLFGLSTSYTINPTSNIPGCFPVYTQPNDPAGTPTQLSIDDRYSAAIPIGFPFVFYGQVYNSLVASTNGYVSFDLSEAGGASHWPIPAGVTGNLPSNSYDRALIMGPYHDLDPSVNVTPPDIIQYQLLGTAPHRRWVLSFYRVPLFSAACNSLRENTHQMILYESTGIIEVAIFSKQQCPSWNSGRSIVGLQDWNKTSGIMAPGRAATDPPWGSINMNEHWRFVPSAGPSLFRRVELRDLAGNLISTGTTSPLTPGVLEASFPNTCVGATGLTTFIVRSVYTKIDDPNTEIFGSDTIRVHRTTAVNAAAAATATICAGATDGTITVTPSAGTGPFTYSLDGGTGVSAAAGHTFSNVPAGAHTITVVDANLCSTTLNVIVTAGPAMTTTVNKTDVLCNSALTGVITVTPPTIGTGPYQYSLDGVSWQSSNIFNGLAAGTYTVYYRSADICPGNSTITITEPAALTVSSVNTNASCDGGTDGTITVSAAGGAPGYEYSVNGTTWQSSNIFNVLPGNYTVSVRDLNGCITTYTTVVDLTNNLTATPQADAVICEGKNTQLALNSNATLYSWAPSTGLSNSTIYNPVANPVATTQYIVTATLGLCSVKDTVMVNVFSAPIPDAGPTGYICFGQSYQLQASGGTQYQWSPVTALSNPASANPVATPTRNIIYTLSIISDINGCASLVTDTVSIDVTPPIKVRTYPYDSVAYQGDTFQLLAVPNDSDVIKYVWTPAFGLSDPNIKDPVVTAGAIGDVALYKVTTSTIAGCAGEGFVTVRVYKGPDIYVPNGFTPNGDGRNDRFTPFPVGMKSYNYFRVYNRWGELIFSTNKLHDGWDGKLGGRDQPAGTYVWMIEGTTNKDKVITKKGTITLIR